MHTKLLQTMCITLNILVDIEPNTD